MRVCRFEQNGEVKAGFYFDDYVVPVQAASEARGDAEVLDSSCLLRLLPHGENHQAASDLLNWVNSDGAAACESLQISCSEIQLKIPNPRPNKLFLLAGNYAKHIEEGGGTARER
ncbi:MAG TPA: 5-carboxymethyl-2-hydroxymuconate isomerase, partial [Planctomycetaceae bacterium]|nr:5-carboxymethyl-2-hydroxymuconate isomerase [Planctomycetaceae bacterium]